MGVTLVKVLTEVNMAQVVVILIVTVFFVIVNITFPYINAFSL